MQITVIPDLPVIPAKAGIQTPVTPAIPCVQSITVHSGVLMTVETRAAGVWILAFAGMTV